MCESETHGVSGICGKLEGVGIEDKNGSKISLQLEELMKDDVLQCL